MIRTPASETTIMFVPWRSITWVFSGKSMADLGNGVIGWHLRPSLVGPRTCGGNASLASVW